VTYANVVVFGALAVVAFWLWQRGRGRPALWAALSFGAVGIVVLGGLVLPDEPENGFQEVVQRINIALLVLFPYLLYRFTTTFERAPTGLERLLGLMTVVLVVWTFALPDFPAEGERQSTAFRVYLLAFLAHWTALSIIAAIRLWRAGRGQPGVAQKRMWLLAAASALITAAILLAGLSPEEDSPLSLAIGLLATASGIAFLLGLAPPPSLRLLSGAGPRPRVCRRRSRGSWARGRRRTSPTACSRRCSASSVPGRSSSGTSREWWSARSRRPRRAISTRQRPSPFPYRAARFRSGRLATRRRSTPTWRRPSTRRRSTGSSRTS
jgi:hypothetical protein